MHDAGWFGAPGKFRGLVLVFGIKWLHCRFKDALFLCFPVDLECSGAPGALMVRTCPGGLWNMCRNIRYAHTRLSKLDTRSALKTHHWLYTEWNSYKCPPNVLWLLGSGGKNHNKAHLILWIALHRIPSWTCRLRWGFRVLVGDPRSSRLVTLLVTLRIVLYGDIGMLCLHTVSENLNGQVPESAWSRR